MGMCRISTQKIMGRLLIGENSLIREACLKITEACPCDCGFCDSKYKNIKVNKPECNYDMIVMLERKRKVVRNE